MNKKFTHNDLVRKVYKELDSEEDTALMEALGKDWKLMEEFQILADSKKRLDAAKYSPSETSIQIILEHSRKTAPLETSC